MKKLTLNERLAEFILFDENKHIIIWRTDGIYRKSSYDNISLLLKDELIEERDYRLAPKNAENFIALWGEDNIRSEWHYLENMLWAKTEITHNSVAVYIRGCEKINIKFDLEENKKFEKIEKPKEEPKEEYRPFEWHEITCNMWFKKKNENHLWQKITSIEQEERPVVWIGKEQIGIHLSELLNLYIMRLDGEKEIRIAGV